MSAEPSKGSTTLLQDSGATVLPSAAKAEKDRPVTAPAPVGEETETPSVSV